MGKKFALLLLTLLVLVGLSGGYVLAGLQAYFRYRQSDLAKEEYCGGRYPVHICVRTPSTIFSAFYPSYVAKQVPVFTITYSSSNPMALVVSLSVLGFSQIQTTSINATPTLQTLSMTPPVISQNLKKLTYELNTSLRVQVLDTDNHLYYLNDSPLLLHSRWLMQWLASNRLEIAAWITPNDPSIDEFVKKAATHLATESPPAPSALVGYSSTTPQEVRAQVDAIYDTLRLDYGIHYLQASVPYSGPGSSDGATQNIKLPAEVLHQRSGMCIELTNLLASAVERIGLHAEIVITPGHAFLGVALTPDNTHFDYWDAVQVNNKVAGDSDNIATNSLYAQAAKQHMLVDTILVSEARNANIDAML